MTDKQHPITPPPELVEQWEYDYYAAKIKHEELIPYVATRAARWGADQELEACCKLLNGASIVPPDSATTYPEDVFAARKRVAKLRAARRPKPPSLKEQALAKLEAMEKLSEASGNTLSDLVRRAIESLPDES